MEQISRVTIKNWIQEHCSLLEVMVQLMKSQMGSLVLEHD